ncbi:MAG TPA: AraC family transcriptional regulator [Polyangiaceae bacterium]|nr:AraC family transcriptional regulator [Polyangiaceae bacterium]
MDVRGVSRKWIYFHETYSFCGASRVEDRADVPWRYRQRTHQMNQGGVQLMEPGELHANLQVAPRADFRVLFLAPSTVQRVCRELGAPDRLPHLTVAQLYDGPVRRILNQLTDVLVERGDIERGELGIYRLIEALWRQGCLELPPTTVLRERGRKAVKAARDLIHSSWNEHLPISTLTSEVRLPLATLERAFREAFGTSPRQYQLHLRLMRGKELFRHGAGSVAEVARQCGFRDPKYFSRVFKREFGCQPSDYLERSELVL